MLQPMAIPDLIPIGEGHSPVGGNTPLCEGAFQCWRKRSTVGGAFHCGRGCSPVGGASCPDILVSTINRLITQLPLVISEG